MAAYKVEICGVNTAKLPILKESEKEEVFAKIKQGDMAPGKLTLREICGSF